LINWSGITLNSDVDRFHQVWGETRSEIMEVSLDATNKSQVFTLPPESLIGLDTNDSLRFDASLGDGNELPNWIVFDRHNGSVSLAKNAPKLADSIKVTIVATDTKNNQVTVKVILKPKFSAGRDKAVHDNQSTQLPASKTMIKPSAKQALTEQIQSTGSQGLQQDAMALLRNLSHVFA
jgi:hypothetical protein